MKTPVILFLLISIVAMSCGNSQSSNKSALTSSPTDSTLMVTCYACHNPNADSHDNIIAPPMVAVKFRYLKSHPEKEDFVNAVKNFVKSPSSEKALMKGPVKRFGTMPPLPIDDHQLEKIATYIYEQKIKEPSWFADHFGEEHGQKWEGQ